MVSASVVVPARDEGARLEATLDSLSAQRFDGDLDLEVIVVASGTETIAAAREHAVVDRVLCDESGSRSDEFGDGPEKTALGPARARNRGAKQASGDVLCFTDADTVVPPTWVRDHCRHYRNATVVGVGGPLEPLEPGLRHRVCFRLLSDWWYRLSWPLGFVQQPGPNCSVRRTAFERVGGFDESLPFLEDTDLSLRLRREGEGIYDRECAVRTSVRRQEREGYGRLFLTYARGYLAYLLPGRSPPATYF